jgi:urease accessory protein
MHTPRPLALLALPLLALLPSAALAHAGHAAAGGLAAGFLHPLGGLDHVLAMVAVGLLAWNLGGRALWLVPLAFVAAMAAAGAIGMAGTALPLVELGIGLSVVAIGGLVALGLRLPTALAMGIAAVFAIFHGHAHGTEMDPTASGLGYGVGFVAASVLLHATGILAGLGLGRLAAGGGVLRRASGAAIAALGVLILAGTL